MCKKFNQYRITKQISQCKMAEMINISQSHLSKIENFQRIPRINLFYDIGYNIHVCPRILIDEYICMGCPLFKNNCNCEGKFKCEI